MRRTTSWTTPLRRSTATSSTWSDPPCRSSFSMRSSVGIGSITERHASMAKHTTAQYTYVCASCLVCGAVLSVAGQRARTRSPSRSRKSSRSKWTNTVGKHTPPSPSPSPTRMPSPSPTLSLCVCPWCAGFQILHALVVDVSPDNRVKGAMNEINANRRLRIAAEEKAAVGTSLVTYLWLWGGRGRACVCVCVCVQAAYIETVKRAEADMESKYLQARHSTWADTHPKTHKASIHSPVCVSHGWLDGWMDGCVQGRGVARQRAAIVKGLKTSVQDFQVNTTHIGLPVACLSVCTHTRVCACAMTAFSMKSMTSRRAATREWTTSRSSTWWGLTSHAHHVHPSIHPCV